MTDVLRSDLFAVRLQRGLPGIVEYRATSGDARLTGGSPLTVLLHDRSTGTYVEGCAPASVCEGGDEASRSFLIHVKAGDGSASLRFRLALEGRSLSVSSEILSESAPYEVASVRLPLFEVSADEPGAALVLPSRSGRLIDLKTAQLEEASHKVDWFEPAPVAMALHDRMVGVLTLDTVDSQFVHAVTEGRIGTISVELIHRHPVKKPELSFLAQRVASCKVRLFAGERVDWTDGARLVRDTIPNNLDDLYVGALIYKVMLQAAGSEDVTTYADVLDLICRVKKLTGGARQIVYLVGWQHRGHDTGYPDVFTANPRVGNFEEFRALKEAAKAENAIVSLHDNYHDAYLDSPAWDPSIVCVEPDGQLRKGGVWGGGQAFEIGPAKYARRCRSRVDWTVDTLGLEQTTHLDVLSDKPDMVDFDPVGPTSREGNAEAKREIVEMFRSRGVDVTSEVLTSPFAPWMHHFWHVERRPVEGWERIPLIPFLYHGKVTAGGDASTDAGKLDQIEYGWTFSADWSRATPDSEIMDLHYLVAVPWSLLARREIAGFRREGDWETVLYGEGTHVRVNRTENRYEVVVDGTLVAKDFATFAPTEDGWVVYSREGGPIDGNVDRELASLLTVEAGWDGRNSFVAAPRTPYRVRLLG